MKTLNLLTLATITLMAGFLATGCKKAPVRLTPLPGQGLAGVGPGTGPGPDTGPGSGLTPGPGAGTAGAALDRGEGVPLSNIRDITGRTPNREKWQNQTVYFDFDRSEVKAGETAKVDTVAREFKSCDPESDILIEGHCDERGTPEYNRALGERRAMALREYLIRAGVNPDHVHTVSFGKDKPAALGHDPASWNKNRRGEFILILPRK
jgi:peptidoglycan-associated lipoprotein